MPPDATPTSVRREPARGDPAIGRRVSVDAIVFDLVLLAFVGALLFTLPGNDAARLLPMLVAIPTFVGGAYQLYVDATPRSHADEAAEEKAATRDVRRRQVLFVGWLIAYFVLAWITSFLLVIPIALFALFRFVNREPALLAAALAAGMWGFIFVLFGLVLGIRF